MDKTKILTILRICAQVVASAICGFITIWCANKVSNLILKGTSLIFENDTLKEHYGMFIAIIIAMLIGLCEIKLAIFPLFGKIFKLNVSTSSIKEMLLDVLELALGIIIGLVTTYIIHLCSTGINVTTDFLLDLINQKWKAFLGIIILAILGIGELKLFIPIVQKKFNSTNKGKGKKVKGKTKA